MMTDKQKQVTEGGHATFSGKVTQAVYDLVNILCEGLEHGTNGNDLFKVFIQTFIESAKHDGPVSPEMKTFLNMLKMEPGWHKAFNFTDITARSEVAQVILILQQAGRHGFGLTMIDKPWMGEPTQTMCVDDVWAWESTAPAQGNQSLSRELRASALCPGLEAQFPCRRPGFNPWVRKIPWRRKWQPTPVFLPGEFLGEEPGRLQSMGSQRVKHD